jgi:prophage regulatory protein
MMVNHMDATHTTTLNRNSRPASATQRPKTSPAALNSPDRFIREPECREITALSRSTRWRLERDGKFPRRRQISAGATGWLASEITAWVEERAA